MKAMSRVNKMEGDERSDHRLLSHLNQNLSMDIQDCRQIRKHVYLARRDDGSPFIVKGFPTRSSLLIQDAFTSSLKKTNFPFTYSFYRSFPPIYFEHRYYGCLEYIEPSNNPFFYDSKENCQEGLALLQKFHFTSQKLVDSYKQLLPIYHLQAKWQERFLLFLKNKDILSFFIPKEIWKDLVFWGEWSLKRLENEKETLLRQQAVILHGDVAHHNFIRTTSGELFLIDFDLISIGPALADYLQYANRILPFLNWSLNELAAYKPIQSYLRQKLFLYALVFPTDIFREWNRLIKEHSYHDPNKVRPLLNLTVNQFEYRQDFVQSIFRTAG